MITLEMVSKGFAKNSILLITVMRLCANKLRPILSSLISIRRISFLEIQAFKATFEEDEHGAAHNVYLSSGV